MARWTVCGQDKAYEIDPRLAPKAETWVLYVEAAGELQAEAAARSFRTKAGRRAIWVMATVEGWPEETPGFVLEAGGQGMEQVGDVWQVDLLPDGGEKLTKL